MLDQLRTSMVRKKLTVKTIRLQGRPGDEILRIAQRLRPDLMVIGSRGFVGMRRICLGTVSRKHIMEGNPIFSTRDDEVDEFWRIVEPILRAWRENRVPLQSI